MDHSLLCVAPSACTFIPLLFMCQIIFGTESKSGIEKRDVFEEKKEESSVSTFLD